jgi:signal transduction histidine kinase
MRRSTGAAVLAVPLLAVLVLAGLGVAASLRAGARAERVRGLVPFTGALTTLVAQLQRERGSSGAQATADRQGPAAAGGELAAARRAVDGAAAAYRDAAVRVDVSDRDRRLHQRLDAGLAQLAELQALRTSVDGGAGTSDATAAATVFRRYTEIIGGLLAVEGEIGLREAGHDAELLRAVTAVAAFSRAKELAEREREAAVRAAALGRLDPAERLRLAALGGRQDAFLDQFGALASQAQRQRYGSAIPVAEAERAGRLRRLALEGGAGVGPAPDLAGWSESATARAQRMGEVEPGLNGEVARLAGLADQAADRRALAYAAVFALALCAVIVLALVAAARTRRATRVGVGRSPGPPRRAAAPVGLAPEPVRRPLREGAVDSRSSVPSPLAMLPVRGPSAIGGPGAEPETGADPGRATGLLDLARRSQELVDQQLELLGQVGHDHADPRLPGRLLQVDRLAVRARRNAHNLVVLAGGEPSRRWDGPVPLAEVVAVAVRDNRDAPRVDLLVADDLLVPAAAADDLANLLGELVDNATAFSAPETRVRISGQKVGSGYVLEVEDRGLGMTDEELEAVNRRLAGHREAGDGREQRLGTWVAGRLAERRDVKVQLRRSAYGGVTALIFFPEHLAMARPATPPAERREARPGTDAPGDQGRKAQGEDAALAKLPLRRYVTHVPEGGPDPPLPKRAPHASLAPDLAAAGDTGRADGPEPRPAARSPEEVRSMLSRYRSGLERGRAAAARDLPDDPEDDPPG